MNTRSFISDNSSGIHPKVLAAIAAANTGHVIAYGEDAYTARAKQKFSDLFSGEVETFFVFGGTAANVLGLSAMLRPYETIICANSAHINQHERGASEHFIGCKILPIPTTNGKITVEQIQALLPASNDPHSYKPRVVSITQPTEVGTLYTVAEIKTIGDFAHTHDMLLHMDGARIANAVASLNIPIADVTKNAGVDVLSFGGTKNGIMGGEAVLVFNPALAKDFEYIRIQGLNLASKMRFIAVQFEALLTNDLWLESAKHANAMAKLLEQEVKEISAITINQPVQANMVFATLPKAIIPIVQKSFYFYVMNELTSEVRWVTSFDTQSEDIMDFVQLLKKTIQLQ